MKRYVAIFLLCTIICLPSSAHSGRTDSRGGHTNRSTGEYHYHHGYPEHQHTNGVCPYDYKNAVKNNTTSGKTTSKAPSTSTVDKSPTTKKKMPLGGNIFEWIMVIVFGGPVVLYVLFYVAFFLFKKSK